MKRKQPRSLKQVAHLKAIQAAHVGTYHTVATRARMSAAHKGKKLSPQHRAKLSAANKGKHHSSKTRVKLSAALRGNKNFLGRTHTPKVRAKLSAAMMGNQNFLGRKHTVETLAKMSGPNHPNWKGGMYGTERHRDMGRAEYINWRNAVYQRDNWTCQWCGKHGGDLHAHHLLGWKEYPAFRYEVPNGVTTCVRCHYDYWHGHSMRLAG